MITLVLSPGATPIIPSIPGINLPNVFTARNVPDSDIIKEYVQEQQPQNAVVIGAGFIGLEMAEMLQEAGLEVTILEASPQVMQPLDPEMAAIVHHHLARLDINLLLNSRAAALEGLERVQEVVLDNGQRVPADLVILGVGVRPETTLARSGWSKDRFYRRHSGRQIPVYL